MANRKAQFTQAELTRCLKAGRAAGFDQIRVEVDQPDGTRVSIVAGKEAENTETSDDIDRMIERLP